jgi:antitoxin CptB
MDVITPPSDAKLIWKCRRGMLELDLILSSFIKNGLVHLTDPERVVFERLLEEPDPDLYAYFMGQDSPHDPELATLVTHLRTQHFI